MARVFFCGRQFGRGRRLPSRYRRLTMPPRSRIPKLKAAPTHYNEGRAPPSSSQPQQSTQTITTQSLHITAPATATATARASVRNSYVTVEETITPLPQSTDANAENLNSDSAENVYHIQDEDTRQSSKRRKTKVRLRRVRFFLSSLTVIDSLFIYSLIHRLIAFGIGRKFGKRLWTNFCVLKAQPDRPFLRFALCVVRLQGTYDVKIV